MQPDAFTVRELTQGLQDALGAWFPGEVWVQGEIATLTRAPTGHVFFQLIDAGPPGSPPDASMSVALFESTKQAVNQALMRAGGVRMTDGMKIRIRGRVELYAPQGRLQLRMTAIDPDYTLGLLATDRERLIGLLDSEGVLRRNHAVPVPVGPVRIGLVTSKGSAAMADFVHELEASGLRWDVRLVDTRVQGVGADHSIARALRLAARHRVDVIALVRGGGARTDLLAFDSEVVARAITSTPVPVFTGVGHEIDSSVADVVAHTACKTPTACASTLVDLVRGALTRAEQSWAAVADRARHAAARAEHLTNARADAVTLLARTRLEQSERRMVHAGQHTARAARHVLARADLRVERDAARLDAVDPARAMARGWSITRTAGGAVVRHPTDVREGDDLITSLVDGAVTSRVLRTTTETPDLPDRGRSR